MILRRIEAEGWGCFPNRIELGPFGEGINVLCGPNGTGKSTLLEMVTRGLLDSHSVGGSDAQALRPWGRSLTPRVTIEFAHGGVEYRLRKRFLDKPAALLEIRDGAGWSRFAENEAGDRHVRELLRADAPGAGLSSSKHWGITQVLWAPQETQEVPSLSGDILADIRASLGSQISSPESLKIQRRFEALYREAYTPTGRLRTGAGEAPVSRLRRAKADAEAAVAHAREELQKLETSCERVAQLRLRHDYCLDAANRLVTDLKQARTQLTVYEGLIARRAERQQRRRAAEAEYFKVKQQIDALQECVAAVVRTEEDLKIIEEELPQASERVEHAQMLHQTTTVGLENALLGHEKAWRATQEAALARRLVADLERKANLRQRIEGAESAGIEVDRCRNAIDELHAPSQQQLADIRAAIKSRDEAKLRLESSLIALELHPITDTSVLVISGDHVGEQALPAGAGTRICGSPIVEVEIPGFGRIRASGPKASTAEYQRRLDQASLKVHELMLPFRTDDLARLEELSAEAASLARQLQSAQGRLQAYLQGSAIADLQSQLKQAETDIEKVRCEHPSWLNQPPDLSAIESAALKIQQDSELALRAAQQASTEAQQALNEAKLHESGLLTSRDHHRAELLDVNRRLGILRADGKSDEMRQEDLKSAALEYDAQRAAVEELDQAIAAFTTDPSITVKRLEPQTEHAEVERDSVREQLRNEEASVRHISSSAPYSALGEADERLATITAECCEEELRTDAVKLLYDTIEACRLEAFASIPDQVAQTAASILHDIAGNAFQALRLSNGLLPVSVSPTCVSTVVPLSDLSGGEKEQVDFSVRLALAKQLARSERQLLVLDDSLTRTDPVRFERILRILNESTDQLQIMILTCNPERYRSLPNVELHDLERTVKTYKVQTAA